MWNTTCKTYARNRTVCVHCMVSYTKRGIMGLLLANLLALRNSCPYMSRVSQWRVACVRETTGISSPDFNTLATPAVSVHPTKPVETDRETISFFFFFFFANDVTSHHKTPLNLEGLSFKEHYGKLTKRWESPTNLQLATMETVSFNAKAAR